MDKQISEKERILFKDWRYYLENKLGKEQWVTVFWMGGTSSELTTVFCALVPNEKVKESLGDTQWELQPGSGRPGYIITRNEKREEVRRYQRCGENDGIEPLVISRDFNKAREPCVEILEEFRLYHDLYYDSMNSKYLALDEVGDDVEVVRILNGYKRVEVRMNYLKQFLYARQSHLAIYFTAIRYSKLSLVELGIEEGRIKVKEDKYLYEVYFGDSHISGLKTMSAIDAKKLIKPADRYIEVFGEEEEGRKYVDFIIGVDENGRDIIHTCEPATLSHQFNQIKGAPSALTLVFFKREVLNKYFGDSKKYTVHDGYIQCHGIWTLDIDNNHEKYVIVFLYQLGRDLPYKEQLYWRSHNVQPEGTISRVSWQRNIQAEFADPEKADLLFKHRFDLFREKWAKKYGWPLFLPLHPRDEYLYKSLHIPSADNRADFDNQVLCLSKVLVDSLNERGLQKNLLEKKPGMKGISKLEAYFTQKAFPGYKPHIKFLRDLYALRSSSVGHKKGKKYEKVAKTFDLENKGLGQVFEDIMTKAIGFIEYLTKSLLPNSSPG